MPVEGSVYSLCEPKEGVDFWEGGFDFAELDVEDCDGAFGIAACYEFAAGDGPVGGEPPQHDAAVEEFADGVEVLRRETPVDDYRALEFFQGVDERRRRCARVEEGVPCGAPGRGGQALRVFPR